MVFLGVKVKAPHCHVAWPGQLRVELPPGVGYWGRRVEGKKERDQGEGRQLSTQKRRRGLEAEVSQGEIPCGRVLRDAKDRMAALRKICFLQPSSVLGAVGKNEGWGYPEKSQETGHWSRLTRVSYIQGRGI